MSKSKKRILHKNKDFEPLSCSRGDAVSYVIKAVKSRTFDKDAISMLSLFGISGEELSEAGLNWEELQALSSYLG